MTEAEPRTAEHNRSQLHAMLMQAPVAICVLSGPEHTFTLANARYEQLTGKTGLVGKTIRDAFPEVERQDINELLDRVSHRHAVSV